MRSTLLKAAPVKFLPAIAAWLALAGMAGAQSSPNTQSAPLPTGLSQNAPVASSQVAPSDSGSSSSGTHLDRPIPGRGHTPGGAKSAGTRGMLTSGANEFHIQQLCFQPGIGWFAAPLPPVLQDSAGDGKSSDTGVSGSNSNLVHYPTVYRGVYSGAKVPRASQCPSISPDAFAPGIGRGDSAGEIQKQLSNPVQGVGENDILLGRLPGNLNAKSANIDDHMKHAPELHPWLTPTETLDPYNPMNTPEQLKALQGRAYISPIKLRRLSRNVTDLKARLELRRIQAALQKRPGKETTEDRTTLAPLATQGRVSRRILSMMKKSCDQKNEKAHSHVPCSRVKR